MVTIESIKEFNNRLNQHKANVQRTQAQLEMTENDLKQKLQALSASVGRQIDESNVEQFYAEIMASLEKQLANGCEILDRIEGKAPAQVEAMPQVVQMPTQPTQPVNPAMISYAAQDPATQAVPPVVQQTPAAPPIVTYPQAAQVAQPTQSAQPAYTVAAPAQAVQPQIVMPTQPTMPAAPTVAPVGTPNAGAMPTVGNMDEQYGFDMNNFGVLSV